MSERPTAIAHRLVAEVVRPGNLVIDATLGNGHDTIFLARLVGIHGQVLGFDVQAEAVTATQDRLQDAGVLSRAKLFTQSHSHLLQYVERETAAAVMFNLGYLPGGDHSLITEAAETLDALEQATLALKPGGILTIICYPGHAGGDSEATAVMNWIKGRGGEIFTQTLGKAPFLATWHAR
jgi:predicted methyltransferase